MKLHPDNPGVVAEHAAARFLQQQGLLLLARNYSCRFGEVDLILREGHTLVFVEVRLRSGRSFSSAAESIDQRKQQKLLRVAHRYMQENPSYGGCRFDVVLFQTADCRSPQWIRNAIEA